MVNACEDVAKCNAPSIPEADRAWSAWKENQT